MYRSSYANVRTLSPSRKTDMYSLQPKKKKGVVRSVLSLMVVGVVVWAGMAITGISQANADAQISEIRSGIPGYCLEDYRNSIKPSTPIVSSLCNGSSAQQFSFSSGRIVKDAKYCIGLIGKNNVALNRCISGNASQEWVRDGVGLMSIANNQCLALAQRTKSKHLVTANCDLTQLSESWTPSQWSGKPINLSSDPLCNQRALGARVACVARREWLAWQTEPRLHPALLNDYTDGNPNEEWCADFVSFVYKEAGAAFSNGERAGWDEYNANYIQYQGFTYHTAGGSYVPRAGDVAYFDYSGGHVEIVVKGGSHPTFIYGDSGTIDPVTGNGNMAENQITSDGSAGQVVYYLSPN